MTEGKVAFCFPGQGSQEVGMGRAMSEAFPAARAVYDHAAEAAGFDVAALCFDGPIERLSETDVTQPALVTTELACLAGLTTAGLQPDYVVGHSVGEYAALAAAGSI
ncbi:MAG TPA: acyltransferase domain-containing protein, partial [Gaiellales bacterium]|nr:acyltransferase domain-containing protein [Gaiellales bacterium]